MVDALKEAHRILRPRGILVDARPDSRVFAYAEHQVGEGKYRSAGVIATAREELVNDRTSDRAVATAVRSGWFRSLRAGRFWHHLLFEDRPAMQRYLDDHPRLVHRVRWMVDASKRRKWEEDPWAIRRAVRYELLERT
jgi:SAM-dependent methyltransferase